MEKDCANSSTPKAVSVKKEALNDDIKEFAETAMNELLGWYGYSNSNNRTLRSESNSSGSPKHNESCGWCSKAVEENTALSSAAAVFCSELCFSQSRRANFKKNKTCDWCRHVRHTVSYVDSQDGSAQLQFCSDKCLNQYKMHIFWRETRAHLELHPHLEESSSGTLITPDLWMNKCKSPTESPSPKPPSEQTSPLPLITVAPPSKLLSNPPQDGSDSKRSRNKSPKKMRKKPALPTVNDMPEDLRVRHTEVGRSEEPARREFTPPNPRFINPQYFGNPEVATQRRIMDGLLPPPTILVPYPLILPFPIPIPVPIPIPIPQNLIRDDSKFREVSSQTEDAAPSDEVGEKISQRPVRKRKRMAEKRTKFVIKNKKILST